MQNLNGQYKSKKFLYWHLDRKNKIFLNEKLENIPNSFKFIDNSDN
jgi:hypothetical protein